MRGNIILAGPAALAALLAGSAAFADVTVDQVWQNWTKTFASGTDGITVGSRKRTGKTLALKDVHTTIINQGSTTRFAIGEIDLTQRPDGTVAMRMSPTMTYAVDVAAPGRPPMSFTLLATQKHMKAVVSGRPDDMIYDFSVGDATLRITDARVGDQAAHVGLTATLTGATERLENTTTARYGPVNVALTAKVGGLAVAFRAGRPGAAQGGVLDLDVKGLTFALDGHDIRAMAAGHLARVLKAGAFMSMGLGFRSLDANYSLDFKDGHSHGSAAVRNARMSVAMASPGVSVDLSSGRTGVSASLPKGPLPKVSLNLARAVLDVTMPLRPDAAPQDYAMKLDLERLTTGKGIWRLIDPGDLLPHDPWTMAADLAGKMTVLGDFAGRAQTPGGARALPARPDTIDLKSLKLAVAGATLSGHGALAFQQAAGAAKPAPTGEIDLRMAGVETLIKDLVRMELVPKDRATEARVMLAALTEPGKTSGTLVSKIAFTRDGHVLANGRRVK
ncbi:hypothetical protein U879_15665 [Defluviimonas sp. 20V17]|uniref:DUF2125 domain-containing protein n=1 Tax=Allgaiera indica TaxID=765699 RepID=A0AAN4UNJ5_9RHOB|nr:DUF2125 domain-containing protein [Allgaiera indica]KDB02749.1 hypothetical protein U879_15665 [Defluviimonas sp. 20V17]GHD98719.1 hypothetical protein GCM10008024_03360 [Allgaiera indica]SDW07696.1 hypothetical protein SAMN05444006_101214 [Allgaiera indica]